MATTSGVHDEAPQVAKAWQLSWTAVRLLCLQFLQVSRQAFELSPNVDTARFQSHAFFKGAALHRQGRHCA